LTGCYTGEGLGQCEVEVGGEKKMGLAVVVHLGHFPNQNL